MTVVLNGVRRNVPDDATLGRAVAQLTDLVQGIAVALNGSVVPRSLWSTTALGDGDEVEVLTAVQGG